MRSIFFKEIRFYFNSLTGYLILCAYFIINALVLWFLDTSNNVFNTQIGVLDSFFIGSAWLFMFLIPALCMGSFSEEMKSGTIEILLTKPVTIFELVLAKWMAAMVLILLVLIPTILNGYVVANLLPEGNYLDLGRFVSGYIGLFFLALVYSSITLSFSSIFKNQVTVFICSLICCFAHYYIWGQLAYLTANNWLYKQLLYIGMENHLVNLSSGLIKFNDLIYFLIHIILLFLIIQLNIKRRLEV